MVTLLLMVTLATVLVLALPGERMATFRRGAKLSPTVGLVLRTIGMLWVVFLP